MKSFKRIRSITKKLLDGMEGIEVDFKESASVDAEDLVAFANHPRGGVLLLGVKEMKAKGKLQRGAPIGCEVNDRTRNAILQKASSCQPPIDVVIAFENTGTNKPLIRIDVPSGRLKPYCTSGGTYKVREDGNNRALVPVHLLGLFVEAESQKFISAFATVANRLRSDFVSAFSEVQEQTTTELSSLETRLSETIDDLDSRLHHSAAEVQENFAQLSEHLGDFERSLGEVFEDINLYNIVEEITSAKEELGVGLDEALALIRVLRTSQREYYGKNGAEDPFCSHIRPRVAAMLHEYRLLRAGSAKNEPEVNKEAIDSVLALYPIEESKLVRELCNR